LHDRTVAGNVQLVPSIPTLLLFSLLALGFAAIPGPSNLFVLTRGIGLGRRSAIASAAGCATGATVYVVLTAAGLAAVIASSQTAFATLHYLGGAYLIVLGLRALRAGERLDLDAGGGDPRLLRDYRQAVLVELSNPKVALFFLALFPQFVHSGHGPVWLQVLVLGALFVAIGFLSDSTYALGSSAIGAWLRRRPAVARRRHQLSAALYLGLGAWTLASGARARAARV
jgi:threonine/homoserine/homoserine lactone efflux protein